MKLPVTNPNHWRLPLLLELGPEDVHELACKAVGTLTTYRLVLGRCLLAMHESKGYRKHGCSSAIHYACAILGLSAPTARECRRVAFRLQGLPELTLAAEYGKIEWGKLREIVRRAVPSTELFWLALAARHSYKELEHLVSRTPHGSVPGEVDHQGDSYRSELRCAASPQLFAMLERLRCVLSIQKDEAVATAEVIEMAVASLMSSGVFGPDELEKARASADKDRLAEEARRMPLVAEARMLAEEMGLLAATADEASSDVSKGGSSQADGPVDGLADQLEAEESRDGAAAAFAADGAFDADACAADGAFDADACAADGATDVDGASTAGRTAATGEEFSECSVRNVSGPGSTGETWRNPRLRFNPAARTATSTQRRELLRRDGWGCRTPGCPNRVWLHLHHLHEYGQGGETSPDNLVCLCSGCHRNLHQGSLKISESDDGALLYTDAEGHRLDHQADIELASWLDLHLGWKGEELDSHGARHWKGQWAVFTS